MLVIILSWLYITVLAYVTGVGMHAFIARLTRCATAMEMHFSVKCLTGLMVITFISVLSCLFIPLSVLSNCLLLAIAGAAGYFCRSDLRLSLRRDRERLREARWYMTVMYIVVIIVIAFLSFKASSHYDDGLYYSTSIKWLQEYGTVKGIANINSRIAFNSSWLILQANFGFQYLAIGLFNDINGVIYLWVFLYSMGGMHDLLRGRTGFQHTLRALFMLPAVAFFFLTDKSDVVLFNANLLNSPSPDLPVCLLIWMVFLLFLEGKNSDREKAPDVLVVLYSAWLCTIKLSALPVLLLSCYIFLRMIRQRYYGKTAVIGGLCLALVIPWMIRSVLISGYLIWPVASTGLFHVSWMYPAPNTQWQADAIRSAALSTDIYRPADTPFRLWFPGWFAGLNPVRQVVAWLVTVAAASYLAGGSWQLVRRKWAFFKVHSRKIVFILTATGGILFWLLQAPDPRFGYGFLLFYCIFFLTGLLQVLLGRGLRYAPFAIILFVLSLSFGYYSNVWVGIKPFFSPPLPYRMPTDMYKATTGDGGDIHLVVTEDSWNAPLPVCTERDFKDIRPVYRGHAIKDGFRAASSSFP